MACQITPFSNILSNINNNMDRNIIINKDVFPVEVEDTFSNLEINESSYETAEKFGLDESSYETAEKFGLNQLFLGCKTDNVEHVRAALNTLDVVISELYNESSQGDYKITTYNDAINRCIESKSIKVIQFFLTSEPNIYNFIDWGSLRKNPEFLKLTNNTNYNVIVNKDISPAEYKFSNLKINKMSIETTEEFGLNELYQGCQTDNVEQVRTAINTLDVVISELVDEESQGDYKIITYNDAINRCIASKSIKVIQFYLTSGPNIYNFIDWGSLRKNPEFVKLPKYKASYKARL